jgi:hypothetical protein
MKTTCPTGALLAAALVLAACGQPAANGNAAAAANVAAPAAQPRQDFTLVNRSGHDVLSLNVSPSDGDNWGPDILGVDRLATGRSATIGFRRGEAQCLWDIRATYDEGETTDARGVNLCQVGTVTLTGDR